MATTLTEPAAEVPSRRASRFAWMLGAIVLAAFLLRVAYLFTHSRQSFFDAFPDHDPFRLGDAYLYQRGAVLLTQGKGFINPYQYDLFHITQQDASHPPLFMLWLWIPSVLGLQTATEAALWSAVLGAGTIVVVGYAGREIIGPRVGLIAAALAAIYPNVFSHDGFLESETMAIFTVTLTVWMAYRYRRRPTRWNAVWVAAGCALATMSRSELSLLVVFLFVPLVLWTRALLLRERFWQLVAGGVAIMILVGPWVVFNLTRFDRPEFISDNFGYTLLTATCDETFYGPSTGYWEYRCAAPTYDRIDAVRNDRSVNDAEFRKAAIDYIKDHKARLPVVVLARWARFAGIWDLAHHFDQVYKDEHVEGREHWIAWGGAIGWYLMLPFAIYGLVVLRRRKLTLIPVLAPYVAVLVAVTVTFYMNRYRASTEAVLCLLAAVGVDALWRRFAPDRREDSLVAEPLP